ncbi:hypothetical protein RNJ44_03894 [Nakaseomyces bracarensis]|uniref:Uncharacterized protein n=1 Tax=Nakaseomyces bracarensis TaxID=273131 RepID=A0ABR4NYB7_9SACH
MDFKWRVGKVDGKLQLIKYSDKWRDEQLVEISVITALTPMLLLNDENEGSFNAYKISGSNLLRQFSDQGFDDKSGKELLRLLSNFFRNSNQTTLQTDEATTCSLTVVDSCLEIEINIDKASTAKVTLERDPIDVKHTVPSLLELTQELCLTVWYRGQLEGLTRGDQSKSVNYRNILKSISDNLESPEFSNVLSIDLAKMFITRDKCIEMKNKMEERLSQSSISYRDETPESDFLQIYDTPDEKGKTGDIRKRNTSTRRDIMLISPTKSITPQLDNQETQSSHGSSGEVPRKKRKFGKIVVSPTKLAKK